MIIEVPTQPYGFRLLRSIDEIGRRTGDEQLRRYGQYLKDTFAKNSQAKPADKAALFLAVGARAAEADDPQIAAVCQHFAGQYYFLSEEYGKAFEHLLAANPMSMVTKRNGWMRWRYTRDDVLVENILTTNMAEFEKQSASCTQSTAAFSYRAYRSVRQPLHYHSSGFQGLI